jgi:hypothetical protein
MHVREIAVHGMRVCNVESIVQSGHCRDPFPSDYRKVHIVNMEVDHIEVALCARNHLDHANVLRKGISTFPAL